MKFECLEFHPWYTNFRRISPATQGGKGGEGPRPLSVFHRCERTDPLNLTDKRFTVASSLNEVEKFKRIRESPESTVRPRDCKIDFSFSQYAIGKLRKKGEIIQKIQKKSSVRGGIFNEHFANPGDLQNIYLSFLY